MPIPSQDLTSGSVAAHIRRIAVPASLGFFFNTMFNVVDTWCAGRFVSIDAMAALGAAFPIFFIILAVSNGLSIACTTLIANALGAGRRGDAERIAAQGVTLAFGVSLLLAAAGYAGTGWMLRKTGCDGGVLELGTRYMHIIFLGAPAFALTQVLTSPLTARGNTRAFRDVILAGCLLNAVLDPWFVLGGFGVPAMGFDGIAVATVLIQYLSVGYVAWMARKAGTLHAGLAPHFRPRAADMLALARQGLPATFNMMTISIGIFIINGFASAFGPAALAAYGVATRIEQIALLPTIGLNFATLALVGQNYGAGRLDRVMETLRLALRYGLMLCVAGGAFVWFGGRPLLRVFAGTEAGAGQVVELGWAYLRVAAFALYAYLTLFVMIYTLQGLKHPVYGMFIAVFRQAAAPLVVFPLFIRAFGLPGLWMGIVGVNGLAAVLTLAYGMWYLRRVRRRVSGALSAG